MAAASAATIVVAEAVVTEVEEGMHPLQRLPGERFRSVICRLWLAPARAGVGDTLPRPWRPLRNVTGNEGEVKVEMGQEE